MKSAPILSLAHKLSVNITVIDIVVAIYRGAEMVSTYDIGAIGSIQILGIVDAHATCDKDWAVPSLLRDFKGAGAVTIGIDEYERAWFGSEFHSLGFEWLIEQCLDLGGTPLKGVT